MSGLRALHKTPPDLVVLDVSMPDLDGWQTLERIRDLTEVPVLMLTARGDELERVRGLQAGADDYVVKPFGRQELVARVQALLRRAAPDAAQQQEHYGDDRLTIDFAQRAVTFDGEAISLTPLEFKLLAAFVRHPRQVLSREQLLELVWGDTYGVSGDQVKLYIGYLRRKLAPKDPAGASDRDGPRLRLQVQAPLGQQLGDARHELARAEGLLHVCSCTGRETLLDVCFLGLCAEQHDGQRARCYVGT